MNLLVPFKGIELENIEAMIRKFNIDYGVWIKRLIVKPSKQYEEGGALLSIDNVKATDVEKRFQN
jgi:hypothetical protein